MHSDMPGTREKTLDQQAISPGQEAEELGTDHTPHINTSTFVLSS